MLIKHWSVALAPQLGRPGRSGPTVCGVTAAVDQDRVNHLGRLVKIDRLQPCQRCLTFIKFLL